MMVEAAPESAPDGVRLFVVFGAFVTGHDRGAVVLRHRQPSGRGDPRLVRLLAPRPFLALPSPCWISWFIRRGS